MDNFDSPVCDNGHDMKLNDKGQWECDVDSCCPVHHEKED